MHRTPFPEGLLNQVSGYPVGVPVSGHLKVGTRMGFSNGFLGDTMRLVGEHTVRTTVFAGRALGSGCRQSGRNPVYSLHEFLWKLQEGTSDGKGVGLHSLPAAF